MLDITVSEVQEPWHKKSDLEVPASDLESDADLTPGTKYQRDANKEPITPLLCAVSSSSV